MDLRTSLYSPTFQIEPQFQSHPASLLTSNSSVLSTTPRGSVDKVDSDGEESEEDELEQEQQTDGTVSEEDYREKTPVQSKSQFQVEIVNQNYMNSDQEDDELTPESSPSSETLVDDQPQPQLQPITSSTSTSTTSPTILSTTPPSKGIIIRYFYPIDPVTSLQQQEPLYDDPRCPAVKPIPEWPPPELVEWRKGKSTGRPKNNAGSKRKAEAMSSDEDDDYYPSFGTRPIKRVRWKSVDDVSFFEPIPPITVNLRNKPFVSLPAQGPVDGTLYRPISILPLTPSSEEDEDTSLGRGKRRRAPKRRLTYPVQNTQSRKPLRTSFPPALDEDFKPNLPKKVSASDRVCHQCRRSNFGPPKPKMKCSFIKPDGNQCVHQYCGTCIVNRYDEPFAPSLTTWTCPVCREICNCSLCLRKQGFGYIWDGALANELKHKRLRHRMRFQDIPKHTKSMNGTIYNIDKPSICKWLARRGVITGSAAWMTQRRKQGVRFVVGRSPSPEPDSSIFVGDCDYVAEFEKMDANKGEGEGGGEMLDTAVVDGIVPTELIDRPSNNGEGEGEILDTPATGIVSAEPTNLPSTRGEGERETLDTAAIDGVVPAEPIDPPSEPKYTDIPPSSNAFDILAQSNLPKGRFFVGKVLKRKAPRSDSQVKHRNATPLPRKSRNVSSVGMSPDGENDGAQCVPQPMMILRPPSKTIGFYARNEDLSEEETESTMDFAGKQQVHRTIVHEGHLSDEDADGTSDDGVEEAHWPVEPSDRDNLPGPSLSYSTPPSTDTSVYTTLYTPTSSYTRPPSPSQAFQLLLGVPLTEQGYSPSLGLNARGIELERHNISGYLVGQGGREGHIIGRSADSLDGNVGMANGLSVDHAPKGLEKTPFDTHIIDPTQDSLNPGVDEFTMPPLSIPGFDDTLYDPSGLDAWITGDTVDEGAAGSSNTSGGL